MKGPFVMPAPEPTSAVSRDGTDGSRDWTDDTRDPMDDTTAAELRGEPSLWTRVLSVQSRESSV
ncbi:hypothetical protein AVR91_0201230 [Amycolatopsis keratiniphila subsp. keratiniphila]|uniref:Uncharacterized protein n=1 Tax=Amycolatopsis keratiniphila subsp. keratiniphila TaxID=227715 RepID=A0A1W2M3W8_9PSEU|nr:hypothetical protein AVR91_0201230 [Amycolatopsis keratiniphila subsp. keratiniphila]